MTVCRSHGLGCAARCKIGSGCAGRPCTSVDLKVQARPGLASFPSHRTVSRFGEAEPAATYTGIHLTAYGNTCQRALCVQFTSPLPSPEKKKSETDPDRRFLVPAGRRWRSGGGGEGGRAGRRSAPTQVCTTTWMLPTAESRGCDGCPGAV